MTDGQALPRFDPNQAVTGSDLNRLADAIEGRLEDQTERRARSEPARGGILGPRPMRGIHG